MRINKFLALATGMSRRAADAAVASGLVLVNGTKTDGHDVTADDIVTYQGKTYAGKEYLSRHATVVMLHKPVGYVVSRDGQGGPTVYTLLPPSLHRLKPVGRLDKDSSGLLLFTDDGDLANRLTHPSYLKAKVYHVTIDSPLQPLHRQMISDFGLNLEDGMSRMSLERLVDGDDTAWQVTIHEGRNRQIRRTFSALGYTVRSLHRTTFGEYRLDDLGQGRHITL